MTFLLISYDKITGQLAAMVSDKYEVKVIYSTRDHTVSILRKADVLTTVGVREDYPAREFIEYCFHTMDALGL
jgi:hypothetical protein